MMLGRFSATKERPGTQKKVGSQKEKEGRRIRAEKKVTSFGGPLPNSQVVSKLQQPPPQQPQQPHQHSRMQPQPTQPSQPSQSLQPTHSQPLPAASTTEDDDPIARARALVAGATFAVQQQQQQQITTTTNDHNMIPLQTNTGATGNTGNTTGNTGNTGNTGVVLTSPRLEEKDESALMAARRLAAAATQAAQTMQGTSHCTSLHLTACR